jgi:protein TonB
MFSTLLESKSHKQKTPGSTAFSVVVHAVLITLAVVATTRASTKMEKPKAEHVDIVDVKKPPPPPDKPLPPPPDMPVAPPPPKGYQILQAPIEIPTVIPKIDLTKSVTSADDYSGRGVVGGLGRGTVGGQGQVTDDDQPRFNFAVDKAAAAIPGQTPPLYPNALKSMHMQGVVEAQFVVDTSGKADMNTFKILSSPHELFSTAVQAAMRNYRFLPAEVGGKKVKVWVQQAFEFKIGG